jgi:hypothetical protein
MRKPFCVSYLPQHVPAEIQLVSRIITITRLLKRTHKRPFAAAGPGVEGLTRDYAALGFVAKSLLTRVGRASFVPHTFRLYDSIAAHLHVK